MDLSRRDVLKLGLFGGAVAVLPLERLGRAGTVQPPSMPALSLPVPFTTPFVRPPVAVPAWQDDTTDYYAMSMRAFQAEIVPGFRTELWGYEGSFPGPTIKVAQGRKVVVRHSNDLPDLHPTLKYAPWSSVHLHGSPSLPQYDGYASDVTNPGQYKDYHYPNSCTARTLWYHDHGVTHTAENVHMGLAAQYQLTDPLEQSLRIPKGEYDVPLVLSDAMFDPQGRLMFFTSDNAGMYGDVVLVNGRPWPAMRVARRKYRFRVLNGSVSRSYEYSLSTGDPFSVIATDAGFMPSPASVRSIRHGMAERYEIVIDFAKYTPGTRVVLRNTNPKNNVAFPNIDKIMAFDVVDDAFSTANNTVPASLNPTNPVMTATEADAVRTRRFDLVRTNGEWTINGHTWADVVRSNFTYVAASPRRGDTEIWEIRNASGGWFHPVHIHLVDFKVLDRNGKAPFAYERGPKDVVYVGEKETVRLLIRFDNGSGKYMMHCHNLVHEDHDMMTQFEVVDDPPGPDPLSEGPNWGPAPTEFP